MTRKDYVLLAHVLKEVRTDCERAQQATPALDRAAQYLAAVLGQDNPRFDRERFLKAAGVK